MSSRAEGLASKCGLPAPQTAEDKAMVIAQSAQILLQQLHALPQKQAEEIAALAEMMGKGGWRWAQIFFTSLAKS